VYSLGHEGKISYCEKNLEEYVPTSKTSRKARGGGPERQKKSEKAGGGQSDWGEITRSRGLKNIYQEEKDVKKGSTNTSTQKEKGT